MSLTPPPKVQKLQEALHAKAKRSPDYRFYLLYDKVYRRDVLAFAYQCCLANGGAAGTDGQTFADIEKYGIGRWLDELTEELKKKTYLSFVASAIRQTATLGSPSPRSVVRLFPQTAFHLEGLTFSPGHKGKTFAKLQEKLAELFDKSLLDIRFKMPFALGQTGALQDVGVFDKVAWLFDFVSLFGQGEDAFTIAAQCEPLE